MPPRARGLELGLIGVGRIGAFHLRTLLELQSVAQVVVVDADEALVARVARRHGVTAAASPEELLDRGIDALVIATPTPAHAPLLSLAAAAGVPAFCEKPVALDLPALDRAIEEVDAARILVQVGLQRRFDRGYRAARDAVASGAVGRLLVVRAATHDPSPPPEAYIATSGGIFRDLHIHDLDAIRFVTGREITEVYADGAVRETPWFASHGDVDAAVATLRLDDGTLAVVTGTRHDPLGYDVRLEVLGTRDSVGVGLDARTALRSLEPEAPARGAASGYADFLDRFAAAYRAELEAFVAAVRTGGATESSLADARAALAAAIAAERSRAEHRPVSVEEVALTRVA